MVTIAALESLSLWQRRQSRASPHHSTGRRNSSPSSTNFTRWTEEPREENGRHHPAGRCLLGFTDDQGAEPCLSGHLETICILPVGTAANCYFTARFSLYFPSCRPAHGFRKDFDRIFIRNRGFREKCMLMTRIKGIAAAYWKPVPFLFLAEALDLISNESGRIIITEILPNVFHTVSATTPEDLATIYLSANRIAPPHEGIELGIGMHQLSVHLQRHMAAKKNMSRRTSRNWVI